MAMSVRSSRLLGWLAALLAMFAAAPAAGQGDDLDARVARALEFTSDKLVARVRNSGLSFQWIGTTDRFWFRKSNADGGSTFIVVDAATGAQAPLFDDHAMARALAVASAPEAPIRAVRVQGDGKSAVVSIAKPDARCRWPQAYDSPISSTCDVPTVSYACDLPVTACDALPENAGASMVAAPDRQRFVFLRDHNLWLKDVASGAERQLTQAGVENFAYGKPHGQTDYGRIERRRAGAPMPISGVFWSPDGRHLLTVRYDLRNVPERLVATEYLPPEGGRPVVHMDRIAIASDATYPEATIEIVDVATGTARQTDANPHLFGEIAAANYLRKGRIWWTNGNVQAWLIGVARGGREAQLIRIDMRTGKATTVIEEKTVSPVAASDIPNVDPAVALLPSGNEAIWFSRRDGWGHLYLYDAASGRVKRQITRGPWVVQELLRVDEASRKILFTAVGRERGRNPYYRHLYTVSIDGGEPQLLTPENADHEFFNASTRGGAQGGSISPSGKFFVDSFSTSTEPDKVVVRTIGGKLVGNVVEADVSALAAIGWRAPEPFVVKAADGTTDLYGVMIKPRNFDPSKKYPVIEIAYPGPTLKFSPTTFQDNFLNATTLDGHAFAEADAIVVGFEGRGGAMRSDAFRTAFLGTEDPLGTADHVAAIRNLAATRPFMDLERVGATGHSWGGYSVLRGMLLYPGFYKVVVSGEGPGGYLQSSIDIATERFLGIPTDQQTIDYFNSFSNESLADRLSGKLLIIHAAADEGVPLQNAMQMYVAFQKANRIYDTLIMPDSSHFGGREPYGVMRTIRYFAENLGGSE